MVAGDVTGDKRLLVFRRPMTSVPLLSVLTTNQKGLIAETAVMHECAKLGIPVAQPLGDERYDLVLDLGTALLRVQCKWAAKPGDVSVVRCRTCRRGREGLIHRSYRAGEIDAVAAYSPDTERCYLLPAELSVECADVALRLAPTKNNQAAGIRWARDFEFAARLKSLQGR
jgi:PD-(D/E)XK nuclease superfamily protein